MMYTGPDAQTIATTLSSTSKRGGKGWWSMRAVCHGGTSEPPRGGSLGVRDDRDYGVAFNCWQGCTREHIVDAIEGVTGLTIKRQFEKDASDTTCRTRPAPTRTAPTPTRQPKIQPTRSLRIPEDPEHPARRWLAARNLWPPDKLLPDSIRWLPADDRKPADMAGSIVHPYAPVAAWLDAHPNLPPASGVQLVNVDRNGAPTLDKDGDDGLNKRTLGQLTHAYFLVGILSPKDAEAVIVVEGLADGLAVVSHYNTNAAVIVMAGTSAMYHPSGELLDYLAQFPDVLGWPDRDCPGDRAWWRLCGRLASTHNIRASSLVPRNKAFKDAAEWSAAKDPQWGQRQSR